MTDVHIYNEIVKNNKDDTFLKGLKLLVNNSLPLFIINIIRCVASMLRFAQEEGILTRVDAMRYIGQRFRIKADLPHWTTDEAICDQLMR